jgi:hypothetical protein
MSGTWNHLQKVWGPTPDTLAKIQTSCKSQESLEEVNVLSPTRHLSFWSSNDYVKLIEYMAYHQWRCQPSFPGKRIIGWSGKRKTTNGDVNCSERGSTRYYPWTKTPEQVAGAINSRDGGGEVTSKPQNAKE